VTPPQVELIRETFPVVEEFAGPMTQLFYGRLFQVAPELRSLFHGNIQVQGVKFAEMLAALAGSASDLQKYAGPLRAMGHRHAGYGVKPVNYPVVGQALLWALGQALESEFTPQVKEAWTALISEVAEMMLAGETPHSPFA
jgi:hemoglobin-like flavoprotein